jgi:four helix bundle protein
MSNSYRDLVVWQKAVDLVVEIYRITENFPKQEMYGLTSQMRRAAVSIPSNIAEGQGRTSKGEFCHFLGTAKGSLVELETQLEIAYRLGFITSSTAEILAPRLLEVSKLLNGLLNSLRNRKN